MASDDVIKDAKNMMLDQSSGDEGGGGGDGGGDGGGVLPRGASGLLLAAARRHRHVSVYFSASARDKVSACNLSPRGPALPFFACLASEPPSLPLS